MSSSLTSALIIVFYPGTKRYNALKHSPKFSQIMMFISKANEQYRLTDNFGKKESATSAHSTVLEICQFADRWYCSLAIFIEKIELLFFKDLRQCDERKICAEFEEI